MSLQRCLLSTTNLSVLILTFKSGSSCNVGKDPPVVDVIFPQDELDRPQAEIYEVDHRQTCSLAQVFFSFSHLSCSLLHCSLYYGDVNSRLLDKVWVPSVILHNLKKEEKKGVLNSPTLLNMAVKEDGSVLVDMSLFTKPTITCNMDFSLFPFDVQHCQLLLQVQFKIDQNYCKTRFLISVLQASQSRDRLILKMLPGLNIGLLF